MLRGSDVVGSAINLSGETVGEHIANWILDVEANRIIGFLISPGGWRGGARVLLWENIQDISAEAIEMAYCSPVIEMSKVMQVRRVLERQPSIIRLDVISRQGKHLGEIVDVYFDETTGDLEGILTAQHLTGDSTATESFLPVTAPLDITHGFVVATADMMAATQHGDPS